MREKIEIYNALKDKKRKGKLINSANELYGACRHKTRFHRFTMLQNPSADDGRSPEKSLGKGISNIFDLKSKIDSQTVQCVPCLTVEI